MAKANSASALDRFRNGEWDRLEWWEIAPLAPIYVVYFAFRELIRDRGTVLTASLAFTTALSVVPLLSVAISLVAAFGLFEEPNSSLTPYIQQLFPAVAADIASYLQDFARSSATEIAGVGLIVLLGIGVFLIHTIERAFNVIWDAGQDRPWQKFLTYVTLITFGPVLITGSFVLTARAQLRLSQFGIDISFVERFLPFTLAFMLFAAMNQFLPHTKVRWYAAVVGGLFTAVAFEVAKWGFNIYVTEIIFEPYNQVYGALGLFPLFLVWLYVVWIITLFGAELSYCTQNLRTLATLQSAAERMPSKHKEHIYNPLVGIEVYAPVARAFKSGEGAMAESQIVHQTGYSAGVVRDVITQLEEAGAVVVVEDSESGERRVLPAKQLDDIQLLPLVMQFFDVDHLEANSIPMASLLDGYRAVTLEALRAQSALALIPRADQLSRRRGDVKPWMPIPKSSLGESSSAVYDEAPEEDGEPEPAPDATQHAYTPEPDTNPLQNAAEPSRSEEKTSPRNGRAAEASEDDGIPFVDLEAQSDDSIELDAEDWESLEIDYDRIIAAASRTDEVDMADVAEGELGDETSFPPPPPAGEER